MANQRLFQGSKGALAKPADARNSQGAPAYAYSGRHVLAQYAVTGCLNNTFYAEASEQLAQVLELTRTVDPDFIAKTAIYARERGTMKDMPALLLAVLSVKSIEHLKWVFGRVIDNGRMLRTFVQIVRSGVVGRKSLGSAPKALVRNWLNTASEQRLLDAAVGNAPSLADVVRMVHPKPADAMREAFYAWLVGKPHAGDALPQGLQDLAMYKYDRSRPVPAVPFQMLATLGLDRAGWAQVARNGGWQMVRMNLNTFARHEVFELEGMAQVVANKLKDRDAIRRSRVLPYQLLAAYTAAGPEIPSGVRDALQEAMEIALENIGTWPGRVVVCPDLSGSMHSPVTGHRKGATTAVRCIDVAGLFAAALLRTQQDVLVVPFEQSVRMVALSAYDSVLTNAQKLAAVGGGGTNCSAPLRWLNAQGQKADLVVFISDNESWMDARRQGATETLRQWNTFKTRNPKAKLVCIDVQPNRTTQAPDRDDILNVGGFSDAVFTTVNAFAMSELRASHWVEEINAVSLN